MTRDEELVYLMGTLLLLLQSVEVQVNIVMTRVLCEDSIRTIDDIMQLEAANRRRTLGQLLRDLRTRFHVNATFEKLLVDFLEHRNIFIHRLSDVPGFNLDTKNGQDVAEQFLRKLNGEAMTVSKIFAAFTQHWLETTEIDETIREVESDFYNSDFYRSLDADILPYVGKLVKRKET